MAVIQPLTFFYPARNKYPFDGTCDKIVRALESRNWTMPGIEMAFENSLRRFVTLVKGDGFALFFLREGTDACAPVYALTIPKCQLILFKNHIEYTRETYISFRGKTDTPEFVYNVAPKGLEPDHIETKKIYQEINEWLEDHVLSRLEAEKIKID